jgi:hypothetical protein
MPPTCQMPCPGALPVASVQWDIGAMPENHAGPIASVCAALTAGQVVEARAIVVGNYPHNPVLSAGRRYSKTERVTTFVGDGYVDRYDGTRLVFPGTLRLLLLRLPHELPFQSNWRWTPVTRCVGTSLPRSIKRCPWRVEAGTQHVATTMPTRLPDADCSRDAVAPH